MSNLYATDGQCHNAEPGTYGHECGKPAVWLGTRPDGFQSGFCDDCRRNGYEARPYTSWQAVTPPAAYAAIIDGKLYGYGVTPAAVRSDFRSQICGAPRSMQSSMLGRVTYQPLDADHASAAAEMLSADVLAWL